jgi:Co/Zn/Cd efflux system component/copper chaperone CopZ
MVTRTKTVFAVPGMDCPSEERLVRMALDGVAGISDLRCDLQARRVTVIHAGDPTPLLEALEPLRLGARLSASGEAASGDVAVPPGEAMEARTLRLLLALNAVMFVVELVAGWLAQSSGLIADSLDMLADAMVYGLSLHAVGRPAATKVRAAHVSGVFQGVLAIGVLTDVVRRFVAGSAPEAPAMIGISLLALAANVGCLALISRHRHGGAHMRASWIFSTNDVLANVGVIVAGALVAWTGSRIPDLVVGTAVGLLVLAGAVRILRLR